MKTALFAFAAAALATALPPATARALDPVATERPIAECPVKQPKVKPSAKPDPKLIERLIQCLWEKPAPKNMDGAQTIDVKSMDIGKPRKASLTDYGARDNDATIYPVLTNYIWKTYYRTRTRMTDNEGVFNCYVDSFGYWQCGLGERRREPTATDLPPVSK